MKDIKIVDGVIHETWDDGTVYPCPIEAYSAEEAEKAKRFILDRIREKDGLLDCLRVMNEIIESMKKVKDSAISSEALRRGEVI